MSENDEVSLGDYIQKRLEQDMERLGVQGEDPTERLISYMKALEEEGSRFTPRKQVKSAVN